MYVKIRSYVVLQGNRGSDGYMDFLGTARSTDLKLDWKPGNSEETYLAVIPVIVPGLYCGHGRDRFCVSSRAGCTPWRTCVASCRTFAQLYKQQTASLYFLPFTAMIFLFHLGMPAHEGQKADNQTGLSVFEQNIVRFWFLWHNIKECHLGHCGVKGQRS